MTLSRKRYATKPRATMLVTVATLKPPPTSSIDSGSNPKKATPMTEPALNPNIRCSLSLNRKANNPPRKVVANAANAINASTDELYQIWHSTKDGVLVLILIDNNYKL